MEVAPERKKQAWMLRYGIGQRREPANLLAAAFFMSWYLSPFFFTRSRLFSHTGAFVSLTPDRDDLDSTTHPLAVVIGVIGG
jgi:hypothetical protein